MTTRNTATATATASTTAMGNHEEIGQHSSRCDKLAQQFHAELLMMKESVPEQYQGVAERFATRMTAFQVKKRLDLRDAKDKREAARIEKEHIQKLQEYKDQYQSEIKELKDTHARQMKEMETQMEALRLQLESKQEKEQELHDTIFGLQAVAALDAAETKMLKVKLEAANKQNSALQNKLRESETLKFSGR